MLNVQREAEPILATVNVSVHVHATQTGYGDAAAVAPHWTAPFHALEPQQQPKLVFPVHALLDVHRHQYHGYVPWVFHQLDEMVFLEINFSL